MTKVINLNDYKENNQPHILHEAICVSCLHRWIEVRPECTLLKDIECPSCGKRGYVISTGQEFNMEVQNAEDKGQIVQADN